MTDRSTFAPRSEIGRDLLSYWQSRRDGRVMPARADFEPQELKRLLPHVLLVDVSHGPLDFRYRLIGTGIVARSEGDYTGMRLVDLPGQRPPSTIWTLYETAVRTRRPSCLAVPYLRDNDRFVEMQALPLSADGESVDMLIGSVVFEDEDDRRLDDSAAM